MVADEMTGGNNARFAHAQQPFRLKPGRCVSMTFLMRRLVAAGLLSALTLLPTPAQAHWGVTWDLSLHHGNAVLAGTLKRDLHELTVTIRPGHTAYFTIAVTRGQHQEPRFHTLVTGCGGGGRFDVRWYTESGAKITSKMAGDGYETPKLGGGESAWFHLVVRASPLSAGSTKDCLIDGGGSRGETALIRVRSRR
jgi:hypothetical protein